MHREREPWMYLGVNGLYYPARQRVCYETAEQYLAKDEYHTVLIADEHNDGCGSASVARDGSRYAVVYLGDGKPTVDAGLTWDLAIRRCHTFAVRMYA